MAFSSRIRTPSGCFGSTVAAGIPANLDLLKEWLRKIYALGKLNFCFSNVYKACLVLFYLLSISFL